MLRKDFRCNIFETNIEMDFKTTLRIHLLSYIIVYMEHFHYVWPIKIRERYANYLEKKIEIKNTHRT